MKTKIMKILISAFFIALYAASQAFCAMAPTTEVALTGEVKVKTEELLTREVLVDMVKPVATAEVPLKNSIGEASANEDIAKLVARIKSGNKLQEENLPNGIHIVFKQNTASDMIVVRLVSRAGSAFETPAENGISTLMFELLKKGNAKMSAEQIAKSIEMTGATFGAEVSKLEGSLELVSTLKSFEKNFDVFSECVNTPTFPQAEVEKEKQFLMAAIKANNDKISEACSKLFYLTMFAGHPYALHQAGTIESVAKITRNQVVNWHKTIFTPDNMTFVVVGNTDYETVKQAISKRFGAIKPAQKPAFVFAEFDKRVAAGAKPPESPKEVRELKDKAQCYIFMGFMTPGVESPDYGALKMITTIMGSGMSSRLFHNLRDKESLAYEITSYYQTLRGNSALVLLMGTRKENFEKAIASLKREVENMQKEMVSEEEYMRVKNKLVGNYAISRNTMQQQAQFIGTWVALGLGASFEDKYLENVLAPTRADIQKAAQKYFDLNKLTLAVIYPSEKKAEDPKGETNPAKGKKNKK